MSLGLQNKLVQLESKFPEYSFNDKKKNRKSLSHVNCKADIIKTVFEIYYIMATIHVDYINYKDHKFANHLRENSLHVLYVE